MALLDNLFDRFRGRARTAALAPTPEPPRLVTLPPVDVDEPDAPRLGRERHSELFFMRYEDARGAVSERRITLRGLSRKRDVTYLAAWCHERRAARTFRLDRVIDLTDLATGEVYDDPTAFIAAHPLYRDRPDEHFERFRADLNFLGFIARADGDYSHEEQAVILAYLDMRVGGAFDRDAAAKSIIRLWPDIEDFQSTLDDLAARSLNDLAPLLAAVVKLVKADKRIEPEEAEILREIEAALQTSGVDVRFKGV